MKHYLSGGYLDAPLAPQRTALFGHLFRLAAEVVKAYRGDLYHDAHTLFTDPTITGTWYFVARESGTDLTRDLDFALAVWRNGAYSARLYGVYVKHNERIDSFHAFITPYTPSS